MNNANFVQTIPNSHWYTDLNQILNDYEFCHGSVTPNKEYILIGLENCIKNGYKLKKINKSIVNETLIYLIFTSIDDIIEYIKSPKFKDNDFQDLLKATINCGYNLTNGLKMFRYEVYKAFDGERDYQDIKWGARNSANGIPDEEKPVSEWLNYIEFHLEKAKTNNYFLDKEKALDELRKVGALVVRALEVHGCPKRKSTDLLVVNENDEIPNGDEVTTYTNETGGNPQAHLTKE
jgi:hypothetical protein